MSTGLAEQIPIVEAATAPDGVTLIGTPAEAYWVGVELMEVLITREQSGAAYDVVRATVAPGGGPPPHRHRREDELFYVVAGTFQFIFNDRSFSAGAGSCVFLPRGSVHTFRNVGERSGTLIIATTPSGLAEFLAEAGTEAEDRRSLPPVTPATFDRIAAACVACDIELLPTWQATRSESPIKPPLDLWVMGLHVRNLLGSAQTNGHFAVAEITAHPGDCVPPHLHRTEGEMFYVLEGTAEFLLPPRTVTAGPGTLVHVPKQTYHGFRNAGSEGNVKMLNFHTPAGFEKFFEELGAVWPDPSVPAPPPGASADVERFIRIANAHGMELAPRD